MEKSAPYFREKFFVYFLNLAGLYFNNSKNQGTVVYFTNYFFCSHTSFRFQLFLVYVDFLAKIRRPVFFGVFSFFFRYWLSKHSLKSDEI